MSTNVVGGRRRALAGTAVLVAAAFLAAGVGGALAASRMHVVSSRTNAGLHERVLVNAKGRTLYSLSVERHGKFVCTGSCLGFWTPLHVPKGTTPTGAPHLGTISRPGSRSKVQVTFRGGPLYTFYGDSKAGDANGNGFKDVGTWHAVAAAS
jgi:predicted lipoprotein with Yx(FWY)xxD motif